MAMARNIPCAGVSTLRAMAENARGMGGVVCAVMDARCGQVYNAMFRVSGDSVERLCPDRALAIADLYAECAPYGAALLLVGDGAELCHRTFSAFGARLLPPMQRFQRAAGVALAAAETDETVTADALMPVYLRLPQAERELRKKNEQAKENSGI